MEKREINKEPKKEQKPQKKRKRKPVTKKELVWQPEKKVIFHSMNDTI
jgi:hypothetical protein